MDDEKHLCIYFEAGSHSADPASLEFIEAHVLRLKPHAAMFHHIFKLGVLPACLSVDHMPTVPGEGRLEKERGKE